jgi:acyl transferase domain-containing protein
LTSANQKFSIIKAVLILENGIIPPNVNFEKVNPKIPLAKWNIQFPMKNTPWPTSGLRRISINSFGVGGTNAHTILDDAYNYFASRGLHALHNTNQRTPTTEEIELLTSDFEKAVTEGDGDASDSTHLVNGIQTNGQNTNLTDAQQVPRIIAVTAFDEKGVQRITKAQADYLKAMRPPRGPDAVSFLDDFAYTMNRKRSEFPWRSYVLAADFSQLAEALSDNVSKPVRARSKLNLGFVFTGQGAQWHAMGRELMVYPVFRQSLETATAYMKSLGATWSLLEELLRDKADSNINQPFIAHPACTALQVALVDLFEFWGVTPTRVVGHSSGEIAAAYCAGRLGREAAWKTAYFRGYVSHKKSKAKGAMLAVGLSEAELKPYLQQIHDQMPGEVSIMMSLEAPFEERITNQRLSVADHRLL